MSLKDMLRRGEIRRDPLAAGEVRRFDSTIRARIDDARNPRNHGVTRLELAYHAILDAASIALRVEGYRPRRGDRHHQVTLETLADTLGIAGRDIDYCLDLARLRHNALYDALGTAQTDVEAAVAAALALSSRLEARLTGRGLAPR